MKLSIIVPAFNEEDRIERTVENTLFYLKKQEYTAEVIVISDGSTDGTKEVVENFESKGRISLKCLEYYPNRGKGYAVRFGMLRGEGDYVMFMDADYSVPIEEVERGITLLNDGYDIAIASRAFSESVIKHHQNFFRELSAKLYTFIQNLYLGIHYKDTQCGFKIYRKQVARELFGKQKLDSVIFDPEILWLAKHSGYSVGEFPVEWSHVEGSRIQYDNIKKSLFIFQELFRIKKLHIK
jgi:dolichyl-phosphate beta-glucosyltransferase